MAVSEQEPYKEYIANGVTQSFELKFDCENQSHLRVRIDDVEAALGSWSLVNGVVVFGTAPSDGKKITIQRNTPFARSTSFQSYDNSFRPETLNKDLDRIWLKLQELGITDHLTTLYVQKLHNEQWQYFDDKDQIIKNIIADLRNYVNQQDSDINSSISNLKSYLDQQDNNQKSYFENLIGQQGVSLQQLDNYYKHLLQGIANIAAEKGWLASLVTDASGKSQQDINNNTAYFYRTVTEMIADIKLSDGVIVGTKGYHNIFDDGGAIYLISAVATDYSIPLANGLHAVFRDTFDIRKFGIVSNATLDQTENLLRMRNYADTRIYEIDFLNFDLMSPKCINFTTSRGAILKGLYFNHVHKLKNAKFFHDKTEQLYHGATPLQFTPKNDGVGLFELENIRFDLYVPNFKIISGDGDGRFHGFLALLHKDFPLSWPSSIQYKTGYSFKFNGIYADTPAVTSTLALTFRVREIDFKNMFGEYWAYYTTHFADRVTGENIHVIFRDDLHIESGRLLVTSAIHEEQEVGVADFVYSQEYQKFKDVSCTKYSTGEQHVVYKRQIMGTPSLGFFKVENCPSKVQWTALGQRLVIDKVELVNCTGIVNVSCSANDIHVERSALKDLMLTNSSATFGKVTFSNSSFDYQFTYNAVLIPRLIINDCSIPKENTNGIVRSNALINKIEIDGLSIEGGRVFECDFDEVIAKNLVYSNTNINRGFVRTGTRSTKSRVNIDSMTSNVLQTGTATIVETTEGNPIDAVVNNSTFQLIPRFNVSSTGSLVYANNYPQLGGTKTFDPPIILAGGILFTEVTANGLKVGDIVEASITQYHDDIDVTAKVRADNIVTVKLKNTGANTIDLPSGTLTVKKI
jgi:hypothetical protein